MTRYLMNSAKQFPSVVYVVWVGTLLVSFSYFMIWPFLAVILYRDYGLNPVEIGTVLTVAALIGGLSAPLSGFLSDKIGRSGIILSGLFVQFVAFVGLATADTLQFIVLSALANVMVRHLIDPAVRALITDVIPQGERRDLAFHLNYFLINVGAATGPIAALLWGLSARQTTFWVGAFVIACYGLVLAIALARLPNVHDASKSSLGFKKTFSVIRSDRAFFWLIIGSIAIAFTYSQQDGTIVQYLNYFTSAEQVVKFLSLIIATNAITVVIFQFPMLRILKRVSYDNRIIFGVVMFILGCLIYAVIDPRWGLGWILGTFVLSIGESVLFPSLNLKTDSLAPDNMKGSYFGASNLYVFGYAAGPLVGGLVLMSDWPSVLWWLVAAISLAGLVAYNISFRLRPHTR